jgi:predicted  nucleic acid-binding Zn-ribbon protein
MAKELTVEEKLRLLFDLQQIDSQIDEFEILKGELPMEVKDLEDEIAGMETRIGKLVNNVEDLEGEISKHQSNIKEAEALIARYEKQMDNVKNNREYDALSKELELQRLEIQLSNKKIKEARHFLENKQETLEANKIRLENKNKDLETKKVELQQIITKTEKEEEKLKKRSDKARKSIEDRLLKSYDRIRTNYRNGLSVVTVERNSCGGCFNKIPPQVQLEIAMRKKIIACEHCGRVLVDENIMVPLVEDAAPKK